MRRAVLFTACLLLASGCGRIGGTPTPLPTVVLDLGGSPSTPSVPTGEVTASGVVTSAHEAHLAFGQGGLVQAVHAAIGDSVRAGDVLVELDATTARLALARAQRTVRELTSKAAIASADQAVALAQQEQDKAQKKVNGLTYPRATEAFIKNLKAQITLARQELADATKSFNHVEDLPDNDPEKARAQIRMSEAQANLNKLIGNYNWYTGQPSEIDVALAYANLDAATAAVQEAQWYADALRGNDAPPEASGARLTALQEARDAVEAAQAQLEATRITSPIDGIIGSVDILPGEFASPGVPLVVVSDLAHLQVETTDLSEIDLPEVAIGQPVTVDVEALGVQAPGRVAAISPVAQTLGGDVVYKVVVTLDEIPSALRPGMSVKVAFGALP